MILKSKNKINDDKEIFYKYNDYYGYDEILGIDARGNLLPEEENENDKNVSNLFRESLKIYLLTINVLDIQAEMEGKGVSYIFLEELKNFAEML